MSVGSLKERIQTLINKTGYQIRRLDPNVSFDDAYSEQRRLMGNNVQVIVEVGAADGRDAAAYCKDFPKAVVHAFEPMPGSFAKLATEAASSDGRLLAYQQAMSDNRGSASFFVAEWEQASSLLKPAVTGSTFDAYHATRQEIEVALETLDLFCMDKGIDHINLLKLDAQGAELKILEGAKQLLSAGKIDVIYSEIQFTELYENAAQFWQIWQLLSQHDYSLHNIYNLNHNHIGKICWGDAIFIRNGKQ
jgi:FkbM family methyltransferase